MSQYLVKKRSTTKENGQFKWVSDYNRDWIGLIQLATDCGCFEKPKTDGDMIAISTIIDVCLESGDFWEFGDYLVYKKA